MIERGGLAGRAALARLAYLRDLARTVPAPALVRAGARKALRTLGRAVRPPLLSPSTEDIARAARALRAWPSPFDQADRARRQVLEGVLGKQPVEVVEAALWAARGRIEVFGRPAATTDFYLDPLSGRSFDPRLAGPAVEDGLAGVDPKGPWEIARAAHLLLLGRAARLAPGCAPVGRAALVEWTRAFARAAPPARGLHFRSPLEIALRAVHLLAGFALLGGAEAFEPTFVAELAEQLLWHGRVLVRELEDTGVVRGNHLVGDFLGLLWLGVALAEPRWQRRARRGLVREMAAQVHADGAAFEGSTGYHRFLLEMFVAAAVQCRAARLELPRAFLARLGRMFAFVGAIRTPAGDDPAIGDGDDGRCLPLTDAPAGRLDELLPVGAVLLGDPALKPPGSRFSEQALWLFGAAGYRRWRALARGPARASVSFVHGGLAVLAQGGDYVAIRFGSRGQNGVGGHGHNDRLSLLACFGGREAVVDPGTGCYTLDPLVRDRFRGTAAHATVLVDGQEQAALGGRPFALFDRTPARALRFAGSAREDRFVAQARGATGDGSPLLHRREVRFDKRRRAVLIIDQLEGSGWHDVALLFPLPSLEGRRAEGAHARRRLRAAVGRLLGPGAGVDPAGVVEIGPPGDPVALLAPLAAQGLLLELGRGWRAPRYGEVRPALVARYVVRARLPCTLTMLLCAASGAVPSANEVPR